MVSSKRIPTGGGTNSSATANQLIRESTKQTNKRVAEQIEAARKTALAKGEAGIRDRVRIPTLTEFAMEDFLPFVEARFAEKPNTLDYYKRGTKNLTAFCSSGSSPAGHDHQRQNCSLHREPPRQGVAGCDY
jgi:hypothetical protein